MSDINKYEQQQKQEEIKITKEPVEQNQEIRGLSQENFATRQNVSNSALGNTDVLPKELVMSSESLEKILSETDGDEEITATKEETLNIVESTLTVPIVSETINKPSYQTSKTLMDAKQGQKVKLADDTKVLEKSMEIEATKEAEAKEKLEKQPEELKENYKELLGFMKEFKDSCLQETNKGNSDLMNNVITQVTAFESLVNSKEFSVGKQHGYIPQLVNMRDAVALYYEKNKGFKWTSKGRRRRELTKNILNKLNDWVGNMPDPILDDYVAEMEKDEHEKIRDLESSKEMYMALGSAFLKKQLQREGKTVLKEAPKEGNKDAWTEKRIRGYLNADSVRYMSVYRSYMRNGKAIENLQPPQSELEELRQQSIKKHGKGIMPDTRSFPYQWGQVKINYDGSPADTENAQKIEKIKESLKAWHSGDIEGMKPFIDEYIKKVIDSKISLEDITPENIHKNGPSLAAFGDAVMSIQNMFEDANSLARLYLETLSPAVQYRLKKAADTVRLYVAYKDIAQCQNFNSYMSFKSSEDWIKPFDINKSKNLLDFLKNSPEKTEDVLRHPAEEEEYREYHYFEKAKGGESFELLNTGDKFKYRCFENNKFENDMVNIVGSETVIGDYYSSRNEKARRKIIGDMFFKDVPKFNFEHPELDEPICAVYKKWEETEEKIASIVSKMKFISDQAEIEKMKEERATLEAQCEEILKEKDILLEKRNATMEELEKNPESKYAAYAYEAKKESERLKVEITPEAVALSKMSKLVDDFKSKEYKDPENEALKKVLPGEKFNRMYAQKIRYINYNNDGAPLTEEDRKNLEWNKAYAKAILENSQEDRIRLIKEDSEYIASLLNRVDWDRVLDFDYWNNNKDLYITLNNFALTAMAFDSNNCLPEDAPILREHFKQKTPMIKLLNEYSDTIVQMNGYFGTRGSLIRVGTQTGDYITAQEVTDQTGTKNMESALEQATKMQVESLKKSLADYNASRN